MSPLLNEAGMTTRRTIVNDKRTSFLLVVVFLALAPTAAVATTWYVNGGSGNDSNNCKSPTTACKTIGQAISLSATGDTIKVAAATYREHIGIPFSLRIVGSGASTTAIDGQGSTSVERLVGISIGASVTLSQLTIRNSAGGGIYNAGRLIISNSTLGGNSAGSSCFKNCESAGGGIYSTGKLTISNSTLGGNSAFICRPPVGCSYDPGGGIFNAGGTVTLQNSIVANNQPNGLECSGTITSHGYNIGDDNSCNFNSTGDLIADPKLGKLGNNGGPTQTIPLLSGSPAIDAGNPRGCTDGLGHLLKTDQRGMRRPDPEDSGGCDMGAYERQSD
jgi:hypothetical protein